MYISFMRGFTFLEVLISLLLLTIILLSFQAAAIYSLQEIRAAFYFTTAVNQLNNMRERLQTIGRYQGLATQITIWNQENQQLLPQGKGDISGYYPNYTVTIYWGTPPPDCQTLHLGQSGCIREQYTL